MRCESYEECHKRKTKKLIYNPYKIAVIRTIVLLNNNFNSACTIVKQNSIVKNNFLCINVSFIN